MRSRSCMRVSSISCCIIHIVEIKIPVYQRAQDWSLIRQVRNAPISPFFLLKISSCFSYLLLFHNSGLNQGYAHTTQEVLSENTENTFRNQAVPYHYDSPKIHPEKRID